MKTVSAIVDIVLIAIIAVLALELRAVDQRITTIESIEKARWQGIKAADGTLSDTMPNLLQVNRYMYRYVRERENADD